ncbi:defensin isoform X1 [Arctopsyche grandis]|uniref:defensin isoform X1 n=1 Tax=Arctopsyche grandis TaxID=121162 RepID=UPI00406D78B8
MKFLFLFAFFLFVATCWASPAQLDLELSDSDPSLIQDQAETEVLQRSKRATCPWFPDACVIHCRSKGFSTGFCRGGTCNCKNH